MSNLHFKAQSGWINDPNGLCFFKGEYHIFYQYFPYDLKWGTMHWGHATTKDFCTYTHHPIALFPSISTDQNGVFSGSALIENNQMHLFYTGVKYNNFANDIHRYGDKLFQSRQLKITSEDGYQFDNFTGKQIIIDELQRPEGDPIHTRDPKVWKKGHHYYLVLGSNTIVNHQQQGALLFYQSSDLINFKQITQFTLSNYGHMWECPDYFEIDKSAFVVFSPEGMMKNCEYSSHVMIGEVNFNYDKNIEMLDELKLIDIGLDCYAPQTFEDENGVRTLISWIRMPKAIEENTIGCLTMPRTLKIINGEVNYQVHPLIEEKFEVVPNQLAINQKESIKIKCTLANNDYITIGNYLITYKAGILRFNRDKIFPIDDYQLKNIALELHKEQITLEIYCDDYVVETFIEKGKYVCTHVIYNNETGFNSTVNYELSQLRARGEG